MATLTEPATPDRYFRPVISAAISEEVIENAAGDVGAPLRVSGFVRFTLGEGIEKQASDFAAEVAAQAAV